MPARRTEVRMDFQLDYAEWKKLDDAIASIYQAPLDQLFETTLDQIQEIVPYSHALTYLIKPNVTENRSFNYRSREIPTDGIESYIHEYCHVDFINWYMKDCPGMAFRESDIVPMHVQEKTPFMQNWMRPLGLYWGVGIPVYRDGAQYGALFLYRSKDENPFSDKDLELLQSVNRHMSQRTSKVFFDEFERRAGECGNGLIFPSESPLTKREQEIVSCIRSGVLRSELSGRLFITNNTLNKHLDNIYKKLGINTFEELVQLANRI